MECVFGDTLNYQGECKKDDKCEEDWSTDYQCGVNGVTYRNKQDLLCNKMSLLHLGQCF